MDAIFRLKLWLILNKFCMLERVLMLIQRAKLTFWISRRGLQKKIRDEETIYLRTPVKKDEVVRVVVNNPNVIIRASSE
jgi:hypothetical protein